MNDRVEKIIPLLIKHHGEAICELNYSTPFELLVAVILSAQCTDKRVNIITKDLFNRFNNPYQYAILTEDELIPLIFSCGFYRNKARNIIAASKSIVENYNGEVPNTIEELVKLEGVGYKTASVIYSVAFSGDAIAVDTHVFRVSRRLGLADDNTPDKVMRQMMSTIDRNHWTRLHHLLVHHGRYICKSQRPMCQECFLTDYCQYYKLRRD